MNHDRLRRQLADFLAPLIIAALLLPVFNAIFRDPTSTAEWLLAAFSVFIIVFAVVLIARERVRSDGFDERFRQREEARSEGQSLVDLTTGFVKDSSDRERQAQERASKGASLLLSAGIALTFVSILGPIAGAIMYFSQDPPATNDDPLRDWRILVGGISFGFLMLAAAAAILKQAARQDEKFFSLNQRVSHFEGVVAAVRLSEKMDKDPPEGHTRKSVHRIVDLLMAPPTDSKIEAKKDEKDPIAEIRQIIVDLEKRMKGSGGGDVE